MVTPKRAFAIAREWRETMPLDVTRLWGNDAAEALRDLASQVESLQADAERLNWMQERLTGASDSERYLPFRVYWGQTRNMRAAVDEARKQS